VNLLYFLRRFVNPAIINPKINPKIPPNPRKLKTANSNHGKSTKNSANVTVVQPKAIAMKEASIDISPIPMKNSPPPIKMLKNMMKINKFHVDPYFP